MTTPPDTPTKEWSQKRTFFPLGFDSACIISRFLFYSPNTSQLFQALLHMQHFDLHHTQELSWQGREGCLCLMHKGGTVGTIIDMANVSATEFNERNVHLWTQPFGHGGRAQHSSWLL